VVHCTVRAGVALERTRLRLAANPVRRAHEEGPQEDAAAHAVRHDGFHRVALDVPWIEVDTTDGYAPGLDEIVAFAGGPRRPASGAPFTPPAEPPSTPPFTPRSPT
jgi:hypothetical protein